MEGISSPRITAVEASRRTFTTVKRGYDPQEVRAYLEQLARALAAWEEREEEIADALAEAEERAKNPVIDDATLTAALGQQSAQILRNAHVEAARISQLAEESAAALTRDAQERAAELRVQAESAAAERVAEAELAAAAAGQEAQRQVEQIIESAHAEAEALLLRAREQGQGVVDAAHESRRQVLEDMAQRRKAMTIQIEQFRAARDELAAAVHGLRDTVDEVIRDLASSDDRARAAATAAQPSVDAPEVDDRGGEPAGASGGTSVGSDDAGSDAVEGLFARLRAGQPDGGEAGDGDQAGAAGEGAGGATAEAVVEEPAVEEPAVEELDPVQARQQALFGPVVAQLAKRMKRALQDDQNRLLDRARGGAASWLPAEAEQRAHYAEAALSSLADAAAAGNLFARELSGDGRGKTPAVDNATVTAVADGLASTVVALLRRQLAEGEGGEAADRIGAAYRAWRGERIERLACDHAVEAFSAGVLAAVGGGAPVQWVVGAAEGPCADCDDNALAGTVAAGEEFPTGHRHPPAHAGCRCLIVPAPA